jgi:DNA-binding NarL/FixJ family response regulator
MSSRILIVDDHPFMRAGLALVIGRQPDMAVVGEAGDSEEALRMLAASPVDLVLADISMPGRTGFEFIRDLRDHHPNIAVLVVSMHDELLYAQRMMHAGARGYIMKAAGVDQVLVAIRRVLSGEIYLSPAVSERVLEDLVGRPQRGSSSPLAKLTDREFEIFQLIGRGQNTRAIAAQLTLSPKTVDVHRGHIREKLGLENAAAVVHAAARWFESSGTSDSSAPKNFA